MARLFRRAATRARRALTVPGVIIAVVVAGAARVAGHRPGRRGRGRVTG